MKIGHFSKFMKLNIHLLLCSKRHYIDEIEYPPSPICGEKPQFESNVTSFQFRQNVLAGMKRLYSNIVISTNRTNIESLLTVVPREIRALLALLIYIPN